jgi:hypothetical protein
LRVNVGRNFPRSVEVKFPTLCFVVISR